MSGEIGSKRTIASSRRSGSYTTGRVQENQSVDYDESVDWALCYGWIDSLIKKIDDQKYARKFTPRKVGSIWSKSNIDRVERLIKEGKMTEYGLALFVERNNKISFAEKFKVEEPPFPPEFFKTIKKNKEAWQNFQKFSPSHKRQYQMWITSAKKADTRDRRIDGGSPLDC